MSIKRDPAVAKAADRSGPPAAGDSCLRIPILMYHSLDSSGSVVSVAPTTFAEQMACLADVGFRGITLREAIAHRRICGFWPARRVVLTFDDGYANFLDAGLPILQRHGFSATVFLVSGHTGGRSDWGPPPPGVGVQPILSGPQIRELVDGGIEIGAHTRSHPDLRRLATDAAEAEVAGCRRDLEDQLGMRVESFAYPFGYVDPASQAIVRREFHAACTTVLRQAANEDLHALPRVDMYYVGSGRRLVRLLNGDLDAYLLCRRWGRSVRRMVLG
jgi:peptidoglycan/xylan/chitin deacetylase (PgdA/CDA1 family)